MKEYILTSADIKDLGHIVEKNFLKMEKELELALDKSSMSQLEQIGFFKCFDDSVSFAKNETKREIRAKSETLQKIKKKEAERCENTGSQEKPTPSKTT